MTLKSSTSARTSIGKKVGPHTYIHKDAFPCLDAELVDIIGQAESLAGSANWNVAKWSEKTNVISLLCYSDFFENPFPRLAYSFVVDLDAETVRENSYKEQENPPILHRKELLLPPGHPKEGEFRRLTEQVEAAGLFREARTIGRERQWLRRIYDAGFKLNGHEITPDPLGSSDLNRGEQYVTDATKVVQRHKTAIRRRQLSTPLQALHRHGYLDGSRTLLDYGCGQGDDLCVLKENGISASGWDPYYSPNVSCETSDIVNLGFVVNVIENPEERVEALRQAFSRARELLVVAVMVGNPGSERWQRWGDGFLTQRGTFQKYFTQAEISQLLSEALDVDPVPVGPGTFFVFRNEADAQQFQERRTQARGLPPTRWQLPDAGTSRSADRFYEHHRELLDGLLTKYCELGRRPRTDEVADCAAVNSACGSLTRALNFLERYRGTEVLNEAAHRRREDLQVFLAMELFNHRRPGGYSASMRRDLMAFFGSQKAALVEAESLLHSLADPVVLFEACRHAYEQGLGYLHGDRAYVVHSDYVGQLPAQLRTYIGCATYLYGDPGAADLIKVHIGSAKLSLMRYDDFEGCALPRLTERIKLNYRTQDFDVYLYGEAFESPYLYIKSRYLGEDFFQYDEQVAFDEQLLSLSWLDFSDQLGPPKEKFDDELSRRWLTVEGMSLVPIPNIPPLEQPCGDHLTFRDLIKCGETQSAKGLENRPEKPETYAALAHLVREVLDPVMDYFGGIELTYGFAGGELARAVPGRNDPSLDQHASYECNRRGNRICNRGGAAVDFIVPDESMAEVAYWVSQNTSFDRLYFYGDDCPVHVSVGPEETREIVYMKVSRNGRRTPQRIKEPERLLYLVSPHA